ncbi:MAG: hypothetical protein ABIW82_00495 [Dokdonella sp.]
MNHPGTRLDEMPTTTLVLAGLAGGIAEVAWVGAYDVVSHASSLEVLRQIVASVAPGLATTPAAPALGMAMHLLLSVALAFAYGKLIAVPVRWCAGPGTSMFAGAVTLGAVWAFNFFVLLPVLNPAFVELMPYAASLVSKLLFGITMGGVLFQRPPLFAAGAFRSGQRSLTNRRAGQPLLD